jgi:NDP-sugar pyrophosphorylase family protein
MVLAAGKGTRLSPLTDEIPKPLASVAGKPIIEHIFELLAKAGTEEIRVNVCHLADAILDRFGAKSYLEDIEIRILRERGLSGTAGGVRRLATLSRPIEDTFVVIMGDALTDVDVTELVAFHWERRALATLALSRVADTSQYGVVELDGEGNVSRFQEKPAPQEAISNLANTGIYVFEPGVLDYIPEETFFDFAADVFPRLLAAGERIVGYEDDFYWSDIGTLEAYRAAQRDALLGAVRVRIPGERQDEGLWVDRRARLHPTAVLRGNVVLGRDAIIESRVELIGEVTVGNGCRVGAGTTLKRSILLPGASVGHGAYLEDCIVGPGCDVSPRKWLRGGVLSRQASPSFELSRILNGSHLAKTKIRQVADARGRLPG